MLPCFLAIWMVITHGMKYFDQLIIRLHGVTPWSAKQNWSALLFPWAVSLLTWSHDKKYHENCSKKPWHLDGSHYACWSGLWETWSVSRCWLLLVGTGNCCNWLARFHNVAWMARICWCCSWPTRPWVVRAWWTLLKPSRSTLSVKSSVMKADMQLCGSCVVKFREHLI